MIRWLIALLLLSPIALPARAGDRAITGEMSVQVARTHLRSSPAYYGSVIATVHYADRLRVVDAKGAWLRGAPPGSRTAGWIHVSALTSRRLEPKSSATEAPTSVSAGELGAAEKGFTEQTEQVHRRRHRELDFTWVDKMEKERVTDDEMIRFLGEGRLRPREGGTP